MLPIEHIWNKNTWFSIIDLSPTCKNSRESGHGDTSELTLQHLSSIWYQTTALSLSVQAWNQYLYKPIKYVLVSMPSFFIFNIESDSIPCGLFCSRSKHLYWFFLFIFSLFLSYFLFFYIQLFFVDFFICFSIPLVYFLFLFLFIYFYILYVFFLIFIGSKLQHVPLHSVILHALVVLFSTMFSWLLNNKLY